MILFKFALGLLAFVASSQPIELWARGFEPNQASSPAKHVGAGRLTPDQITEKVITAQFDRWTRKGTKDVPWLNSSGGKTSVDAAAKKRAFTQLYKNIVKYNPKFATECPNPPDCFEYGKILSKTGERHVLIINEPPKRGEDGETHAEALAFVIDDHAGKNGVGIVEKKTFVDHDHNAILVALGLTSCPNPPDCHHDDDSCDTPPCSRDCDSPSCGKHVEGDNPLQQAPAAFPGDPRQKMQQLEEGDHPKGTKAL